MEAPLYWVDIPTSIGFMQFQSEEDRNKPRVTVPGSYETRVVQAITFFFCSRFNVLGVFLASVLKFNALEQGLLTFNQGGWVCG